MTNDPTKGGAISIAVSTDFDPSAKETRAPQAVAYAFSQGGKLLGYAPLDEKHQANVPTALAGIKEQTPVRIILGPASDDMMLKSDVLLSDLMRRGAVEQHVTLTPNNTGAKAQFKIPSGIWPCWFGHICNVRGRLLKRSVNGLADMPVCNATVEVYEVEPLRIIIPKLPDDIIKKLRDIILYPIPIPDPVGPVELNPQPLPPAELGNLSRYGINPQPLPPRVGNLKTSVGMPGTVAVGAAELTALKATTTISAPIALQHLAQNASAFQLRQGLLDHIEWLRPIFCYYYPFWVTKHLVATLHTDNCGHFQGFFWRGCYDTDAPDLYFTARQRFGFVELPILEQLPVGCHTYWNYACGSEVTLYTTSPFATVCQPCDHVIVGGDNWVCAFAIGNTSLHTLRGASQALAPTTNAGNIGLTGGGAPWGGLLRLRLEFDNALRDSLNIRYYKVSWRRGTSGTFNALTASVSRHYSHDIGAPGSPVIVFEQYALGPRTVGTSGNLFEIPPSLPPTGQWVIADAVEDTTSAKFDTTLFAPPADAGLYQLKVELYDGAGILVNIENYVDPAHVSHAIRYILPDVDNLAGTIPTQPAAALGLVQNDGIDLAHKGLILTLHVDNNPCTASISPPNLNAINANDCGALTYNPALPGTVNMPFTASHPNGFATYSLSIVRGTTGLTGDGGTVGAGSHVFSRSVHDLLTENETHTPACTLAGFGEYLYVAAMATDGWSRQSGLDAARQTAFVLAPQ